MIVKLPSPVLNSFRALSEVQQEKVKVIVGTHVKACRKLGVGLEYLERVWIEAIEEVKLAPRRQVRDVPLPPDAAYHHRRYGVYDAPRDL